MKLKQSAIGTIFLIVINSIFIPFFSWAAANTNILICRIDNGMEANFTLDIGSEVFSSANNEPNGNSHFVTNNKIDKQSKGRIARFEVDNITCPRMAILRAQDTTGKLLFIYANFILFPDDTLKIVYDGLGLHFYGKNQAKYQVFYELQKIDNLYPTWQQPEDKTKGVSFFEKMDTAAEASMKILDQYRAQIGDSTFWYLKGSTLMKYQSIKSGFITGGIRTYDFGRQRCYPMIKNLGLYNNPYWNISKELDENPIFSATHFYKDLYLDFQIDQYIYDSCYRINRAFDLYKCCRYFEKRFQGNSRQQVLYLLLSDSRLRGRYPFHNIIVDCITNDIQSKYIYDDGMQAALKAIRSSIAIGEPAFNFELPDTDNKRVSLSDLRGNVVLVDFWFFGCGNCIDVHPYLDSIRQVYADKDFKLVSICYMPDEKMKQKWIHPNPERDKYTSEGNINLWVTHSQEQPSSLVKYYHIEGAPSYLLIDKQGNLLEQIIDPRVDKGKDAIQKIEKALTNAGEE